MDKPCRDRFLAALNLEEPDKVPVTDLGLDPPIVEAITGIKLGGLSLITVSGKKDLWESSVRSRMALSKACLKLGFDAVPAVSDYTLCSYAYKPKFISESGRFVDEWGRILESRPENRTMWYVGGTVKTVEEMEEYTPPDPNEDGRFELIEKVLKFLKEKDVVIMGQGHSGWHMAFQIRGGIDKLLIDMYVRPKAARKFMERVADACLGMAMLMMEAGVEVLFITDDYADCHSPFMNPSQFRKFELPNLKRIIEAANKKGVPVLKHSDGNVEPIILDMIEAGIIGFHPFEPGTMELGEAKRNYGDKICIIGNVDCRYILPFGDDEDVRMDVRRCINSAAFGGGYILASSNSIHANCKVENVYAMVDEARKYGRYKK